MSQSFVFVRNRARPVVALFVHGFRGDSKRTWDALRSVLENDATFAADVGLWSYSTGALKKVPTVWDAADQLQTEIRVRLSAYRRIVLVGHSLGGIVIRAMVVRALQEGRIEDCERIDHIVTLGTPNDGVQFAGIVAKFSKQIADLRMAGDTVVDLRNEWIDRVYAPNIRPGEERTKLRIPLTTVVGLEDQVVTASSAKSFFRQPPPESVPGDHLSMKEPADTTDTIYLLVKRIVADALSAVPLAVATIDDVLELQGSKGQFVLEVLLNNTASRAEFRSREVALGGRVALSQMGASPFYSRALFSVEMYGGLDAQLGDQPLSGLVRPEDDEFAYRLDGRFEHVNGTPQKSWEYSLRFPALVRCPAGEKLQLRLAFQTAKRRLMETENTGEFRASYIGGVIDQRFWVEIIGDDGLVRHESADDGLLTFIANEAEIIADE